MGSANTVAASGKDTPCFARFDSALVESHSKSPSTTVGIALPSMVYGPYTVKRCQVRLTILPISDGRTSEPGGDRHARPSPTAVGQRLTGQGDAATEASESCARAPAESLPTLVRRTPPAVIRRGRTLCPRRPFRVSKRFSDHEQRIARSRFLLPKDPQDLFRGVEPCAFRQGSLFMSTAYTAALISFYTVNNNAQRSSNGTKTIPSTS